MEMFNAIATLVVLIVILGAITVGMFSAGWYFFEMPTRSSSRYYHLCYT